VPGRHLGTGRSAKSITISRRTRFDATNFSAVWHTYHASLAQLLSYITINVPDANVPLLTGAMNGKRKWTPSTSNALVDHEYANQFVQKQRSDVNTAVQSLGDTLPGFAQDQARNAATRTDSGVYQSLGVHSPHLPSLSDAELERKNAHENKARLELRGHKNTGVRVILRAQGFPDFKLMALPVRIQERIMPTDIC
jgi:hypothetical protein